MATARTEIPASVMAMTKQNGQSKPMTLQSGSLTSSTQSGKAPVVPQKGSSIPQSSGGIRYVLRFSHTDCIQHVVELDMIQLINGTNVFYREQLFLGLEMTGRSACSFHRKTQE